MADRKTSDLPLAQTQDLTNDDSYLHLVNPGRASDAEKDRRATRAAFIDEFIRKGGANGVASLDGAQRLVQTAKLMAQGTAGAPGMAFEGDTDTGVYRSDANRLSVSAGGSQRAEFDGSGLNVIGGATQALRVNGERAVDRGGSSSNGYVKFYNGTMICTALVSPSSSVDVDMASAGGYISAYYTAFWNQPFADTPAVYATNSVGGALLIAATGYSNRAEVRWWRPSSATGVSVSARVIGIGRWY